MFAEVRAGYRSPYFIPWMGARYRENLQSWLEDRPDPSRPYRVHLLGESHYFDEADSIPTPQATVEAVTRCGCGVVRTGNAFWTKAIRLVDNTQAVHLDRASAWNGVAFSNFLQTRKLTGPRQSNEPDSWEEAKDSFFGQMAITVPNLLIVMGRRVWRELPSPLIEWPEIEFYPDKPKAYNVRLYVVDTSRGPRKFVAVNVAHPSSGRHCHVTEYGAVEVTRLLLSNLVSSYPGD